MSASPVELPKNGPENEQPADIKAELQRAKKEIEAAGDAKDSQMKGAEQITAKELDELRRNVELTMNQNPDVRLNRRAA